MSVLTSSFFSYTSRVPSPLFTSFNDFTLLSSIMLGIFIFLPSFFNAYCDWMTEDSSHFLKERGVGFWSRIYKESEDEIKEGPSLDIGRRGRGIASLAIRQVPYNLRNFEVTIDSNPPPTRVWRRVP